MKAAGRRSLWRPSRRRTLQGRRHRRERMSSEEADKHPRSLRGQDGHLEAGQGPVTRGHAGIHRRR